MQNDGITAKSPSGEVPQKEDWYGSGQTVTSVDCFWRARFISIQKLNIINIWLCMMANNNVHI